MLFCVSEPLSDENSILLGYEPPEGGEGLGVDLWESGSEGRFLWRRFVLDGCATCCALEVECGRDIGKIRSSPSYLCEWYSFVALVRRLGEDGGRLDRGFLYYPLDVRQKGGTQCVWFCTHLRVTPARHSSERGGNGERRRDEKIVQQNIFLPRTDAMHQSQVTKTANYGSFRALGSRWLARSSTNNELGSRTCRHYGRMTRNRTTSTLGRLGR